jgi:hypothetical protein
MAVFKLQTNIGDPSFAEIFIAQGGLAKLRNLSLYSNGNTLAYALTSFSRLLELDKGWDYVTPDLVSRVSAARRRRSIAARGLRKEKECTRSQLLLVLGRGADSYTPAR